MKLGSEVEVSVGRIGKNESSQTGFAKNKIKPILAYSYCKGMYVLIFFCFFLCFWDFEHSKTHSQNKKNKNGNKKITKIYTLGYLWMTMFWLHVKVASQMFMAHNLKSKTFCEVICK